MSALYEILRHVDGIESEIKLRATHASFMNDPSENRYFVDCLVEALREDGLHIGESEPNLWLHLKRSIEDIDSFGEPTIFSLSEHDDELPMWQTYGHKGQGVAIGFYSTVLNTLEEEGWVLKQCDYEWKDEIKEATNIDALRNCFTRSEEGKVYTNDINVMSLTQDQRTKFKHPAYHYEKEWRLVHDTPQKYDYRESQGLIIPYYEITMPVKAISEIVIGPTANPQLSEKSLFLFLSDLRISIPRTKSQIPYSLL